MQCPTCGGEGREYWNYGHSSSKCTTCDGIGTITTEQYIRGKGQFLGYSGRMLEEYVNDYFSRNQLIVRAFDKGSYKK